MLKLRVLRDGIKGCVVAFISYLLDVIASFQSRWKRILRQPGVEPGSIAWKATMLTATPLTLAYLVWVVYSI